MKWDINLKSKFQIQAPKVKKYLLRVNFSVYFVNPEKETYLKVHYYALPCILQIEHKY